MDELKFRPRKKKVKVSDKELKELGNLEDKKGDSKLNEINQKGNDYYERSI